MEHPYIANPRTICPECSVDGQTQKKLRLRCEACQRTGYAQADLHDLWAPQPGFLVCGGPSLRTIDLSQLQRRGVMTLGINNAGVYANCNAMTFGDSQWKFHSAGFFNPKCMMFAPVGKMNRCVRMQDSKTGEFWFSDKKIKDCPNTYGICRTGLFDAETFFDTWFLHWGHGGKESNRPFTRLVAMLLGFRLLHYLGCRTIYLVGADFNLPAKRAYKRRPRRNPAYAWGASPSGGNSIWWKIDKMFEDLKPAMARHGLQAFNCNPDTKSTAFPYVSFDQAIAHATQPFGHEKYDLSQWYESSTMKAHKELRPDPISAYKA